MPGNLIGPTNRARTRKKKLPHEKVKAKGPMDPVISFMAAIEIKEPIAR
jgi:hypothetical protein